MSASTGKYKTARMCFLAVTALVAAAYVVEVFSRIMKIAFGASAGLMAGAVVAWLVVTALHWDQSALSN